MLRILILCIYVQSAVFKNTEKSYDQEYEKGILKSDTWAPNESVQNALVYSGENSHKNNEDKSHDIDINKNDAPPIELAESRRSAVLRWFKDLLVPTETPISYKKFKDMTRERKDYSTNNVTEILLRLVDVLENLNKNLVETGYITVPVPINKTVTRYRRDTVGASKVSAENISSNNKSNITTKQNIDKDDKFKDSEIVVEDNEKKDKTTANIEDKLNEETTTEYIYTPLKNIARVGDNKELNVTLTNNATKVSNNLTKNITVPTKETSDSDEQKNTLVKDNNNSSKTDNTGKEKTNPVIEKYSTSKEKHGSTKHKNSSKEDSSDENGSAKNNYNYSREQSSSEEKISAKHSSSSEDASVASEDKTTENSYTLNASTTVNNTEDDTPSLLRVAPIVVPSNNYTVNSSSDANPRRTITATSLTSKVRQKLLVYLDDMFIDIANKIQPLTRVKLAMSPDNSYRIGYIVANIDTLEIKLKKLKQDMSLHKDYWNDAKILEVFDQLKVTNNVVSSLIDTLTSYLPLPII